MKSSKIYSKSRLEKKKPNSFKVGRTRGIFSYKRKRYNKAYDKKAIEYYKEDNKR